MAVHCLCLCMCVCVQEHDDASDSVTLCRMGNLPCDIIIIWLNQTATVGLKAVPLYKAKALQSQYVWRLAA